jgi:hypothetical protein
MKERNLFRLGHIRDCIAKVEYPANRLHNYDNFEKQWVEQDAIIRNLEIIGEASVNDSQSGLCVFHHDAALISEPRRQTIRAIVFITQPINQFLTINCYKI